MTPDPTYPPLDVLKPVADNLWIVDSGPIGVGPIQLPVRMTVVRLPSGEVWLHSPTRHDDALRRSIEALGPIRHFVAPNSAHWTFLTEWQRHCPEAKTSAAPGLRQRGQVRRSGVRLDRDLVDTAPDDWAEAVDQAIVPGGLGFREVAFLHRPSRTLVLTDLVVNLEAEKLPTAARIFAGLTGVLAPDGKAPAYLRLVIRLKREAARAAAKRVLAWNPERVIFSHGRWFARDGTRELARSLRWLVG